MQVLVMPLQVIEGQISELRPFNPGLRMPLRAWNDQMLFDASVRDYGSRIQSRKPGASASAPNSK
jgi:hypothetical protein